MQVPEELAAKSTRWLPVILELNLVAFQTSAAAVANEHIRFLLEGPSPAEVLKHHPSKTTQTRLERLLALNHADMLSERERRELDELEQIEHVIRMAKLRIRQQES